MMLKILIKIAVHLLLCLFIILLVNGIRIILSKPRYNVHNCSTCAHCARVYTKHNSFGEEYKYYKCGHGNVADQGFDEKDLPEYCWCWQGRKVQR